MSGRKPSDKRVELKGGATFELPPLDAAVAAFSFVVNACEPPSAAEQLQDLFVQGCPRCGVAVRPVGESFVECARGHRWSF